MGPVRHGCEGSPFDLSTPPIDDQRTPTARQDPNLGTAGLPWRCVPPHKFSQSVRQLAEDRFVYIIVDAGRASGAVNMIWFDNPVATVAGIKARGLEPTEIEKHDPVWKYVFHDPAGNEIGIGGNLSGTD